MLPKRCFVIRRDKDAKTSKCSSAEGDNKYGKSSITNKPRPKICLIFPEDISELIFFKSGSLRNNLLELGVTQMSAGSITSPGGYSFEESAKEQFSVVDKRSPDQFVKYLRSRGYDPVWKDWDKTLDL